MTASSRWLVVNLDTLHSHACLRSQLFRIDMMPPVNSERRGGKDGCHRCGLDTRRSVSFGSYVSSHARKPALAGGWRFPRQNPQVMVILCREEAAIPTPPRLEPTVGALHELSVTLRRIEMQLAFNGSTRRPSLLHNISS